MACSLSTLHFPNVLRTSICAALLGFSSTAHAATRTWIGGSGNSWGTTLNWAGALVPTSADDVVFNNFGAINSVSLGSARAANSLTFSGTLAYTLQTGSLSLSTGNITSDGVATQRITSPITLGATGTWNVAGTQPLEIGGGITDANNNFTLRKSGTGLLKLVGTDANLLSFTNVAGTTLVSGGTLSLRSTGTSTFPILMNGGTFRIQDGAVATAVSGSFIAIGVDTAGTRPQLIVANPTTRLSGGNLFVGVNPGDLGEVIVENSARLETINSLVIGQRATTEASATFRSSATSVNARVLLGGINSSLNGAKATLRIESGASVATGQMSIFTNDGTISVDRAVLEAASWVDSSGFRADVDLVSNPASGMALRLPITASSTIWSTIRGGGGIEMTGAGTLALMSAENSFNGLRITQGTVSVDRDNLGAPFAPVYLNGGKLTATAAFQTPRPVVAETFGSVEVAAGTVFSSLGGLHGAGFVVKRGNGTWALSGKGSMSGTLSAFEGTLSLKTPELFSPTTSLVVGSGAMVALEDNSQVFGQLSGSGTIDLGSSASTKVTLRTSGAATYTGSFVGAGTVVLEGGGSFSVLGGATNTGGYLIRDGTIGTAGTDWKATIHLDGGQFFAGASFVTAKEIDVRSSGTFQTPGGVLTQWRAIEGTGDLTVTGSGTLRIAGNSSYAGRITVDTGNLHVGTTQTFGEAVRFDLRNAGKLSLNGFNQTIGLLSGEASTELLLSGATLALAQDSASTFAGVISGPGALVKSGPGTLTLTGQSSYAGGTTITGGTLKLSGGPDRLVAGSALSFVGTGNATLELENTTQTVSSLAGGSSALVRMTTSALTANQSTNTTFAGSIIGNGSFIKAGDGTLTLSGSNSFSGEVRVSGGTLVAGSSALGGTGTLRVDAGAELAASGSIVRSVVPEGGGTIRATGDLFIGLSTSISGFKHGGALDVGSNHVLLLDADRAQLGSVTLLSEGGRLSGLNGIELLASSVLVASENATIESALTNSGTIQGPAAAGSMLTFSGSVSGSGSYAGNLRMLSSFSPGDGPIRLPIGGDLITGSRNVLSMQLAGKVLGSGYDHLDVNGSFAIGGTLSLSLLNGFTPALGDTFDLFDASSVIGTFGQLDLPALAPGLSWNTTNLYDTGTLAVVPEPGAAFLVLAGTIALAVKRPRRRVA